MVERQNATFCPDGSLRETQFCNTDVCQAPACYGSYVTFYDSFRRQSVGNTDNCDKAKVDGTSWYRFHLATGENGVLDRCPKPQTCGGLQPLWIKGSHPTQYGVVKRLTIHSSTAFIECNYKHGSVLVTKCNINEEKFYLYKLLKPDTCDYSYCTKVYNL